MDDKFRNTDRHRVIEEMEKELGSPLKEAGVGDTVVSDTGGNIYVVIGGRDTWARVEQRQLEALRNSNRNPMLVWAYMKGHNIDVYEGSLSRFLSAGEIFQNMIFIVDGRIARVEGTELRLKKWFEFPYAASDRDAQRQKENARKVTDELTDEQLIELAKRRGLKPSKDDEYA